nr:unnamed protein product [Callosobruchus chinensis]
MYQTSNLQNHICDSDLNVLHVDATFGAATHDAYIWRQSEALGHLRDLHSLGETAWFLGDSAYPLRPWMLTPIAYAQPDSPEAHYTQMHCSTRNTVERCIGSLKARWRCLLVHRVLHYDHHMVAKIINACAVLHNMCNRHQIPAPQLPAVLQVQENKQAEAVPPDTLRHSCWSEGTNNTQPRPVHPEGDSADQLANYLANLDLETRETETTSNFLVRK